ncbi:hypothetical protein ISU10_11315 [Nocardioides agariphilus]|uniref:Rhamnan synthesis protein F n=1 Tax=Nocardioides agariphilus TaxID=433664 RepID=A0A930YH76_9ACTN|nr:hypothetical protein [Nocardioides agariphilus]
MPPREFDHVLLTRFSAVMSPGAEPAGEEWLRYRLAFFDDLLYPSVISQTGVQAGRDFTWLVLFDDRCSPEFRHDVEYLAADVFTPIWTHEDFRRDSFAEHVVAATDRDGGPAPYLITTRIDSDDGMAVDFMETVQAQFARQDRLFVSLTRGVQVDRSGAVYLSSQISNAFISLIERREPGRPPDTVYVAKHARARAHGPIREVRAPVMWMQVVHDLNVANMINAPRTSPRIVAERFRIDLAYDTTIGGRALLGARVRQAGKLARLWAAHPGELTKFLEAQAARARGTHDRPQDDGKTLTDRALGLDRDVRFWWAGSGLRRRAERAKRDARATKWRVQRRLNESLPATPRVVAGDLDAVLAEDRVVLLAEYSLGRDLRPESLSGAAAWAEAGIPVLVISARDAWSRWGPILDELPRGVAVVQRPNVGYDFGSWGAALTAYPSIASKHLVVLTNDSLAGPYGPLDDLVGRIEASSAEVWSATGNHFPQDHMQSYLLAFRDGVLGREPLRGFFADVRAQETKKAVIQTYEFGLSQLVQQHGLSAEVGWSKEALGISSSADSVLGGWARMLATGFPFVKRTLLEQRRFADLRGPIATVVQQEYGVEL